MEHRLGAYKGMASQKRQFFFINIIIILLAGVRRETIDKFSTYCLEKKMRDAIRDYAKYRIVLCEYHYSLASTAFPASVQ